MRLTITSEIQDLGAILQEVQDDITYIANDLLDDDGNPCLILRDYYTETSKDGNVRVYGHTIQELDEAIFRCLRRLGSIRWEAEEAEEAD